MTDKSKYKTYAPFGVRKTRYENWGQFPQFEHKVSYTGAGPGSYNNVKPECHYKNGIDWTIKSNVEEFSKWWGWKCLSIREKRKCYESLNGPGTHEIDPALFKQKSCAVLENLDFTKGKRHSYINAPNTPSPDRYFPDLDKRTPKKKGFTTEPTFEWDGFVSRFRVGAPPKYLLPPNMYKVTENDGKAIADIIKKVVSTRGPYDLFTGNRDETTLKSFWGPPLCRVPDRFFMPTSSVEYLLFSQNRARNGKFFKRARFPSIPTERNLLRDIHLCYKNPRDPGPATYNMANHKAILPSSKSYYPFDTCKIYVRPHPSEKSFIHPGPGRYNTRLNKCTKRKRNSFVFLSKYPRLYSRDFNYKSF